MAGRKPKKPKDVLKQAQALVREWKPRPEILLCPNTPRPMHGVVPRELLGPKWWNATRREAYRSTNYHCVACEVSKYNAKARKWLEGHEVYTVNYLKGTWTYIETVPLCHYCHNYIHGGRMLALLQKGQMNQGKYAGVIQHGDKVLSQAGLDRFPPYPGPFAAWSKWRLLLKGKKYPPKFKTEFQWEQAHND